MLISVTVMSTPFNELLMPTTSIKSPTLKFASSCGINAD